MNVKIAIVLVSVLAPITVASAAGEGVPAIALAEARTGECSGILRADHGSIEFGGGPGEGEGICVVAKSERRKVLAACSVGHFCRVKGSVANCHGSGECAEIGRIKSVQKY